MPPGDRGGGGGMGGSRGRYPWCNSMEGHFAFSFPSKCFYMVPLLPPFAVVSVPVS